MSNTKKIVFQLIDIMCIQVVSSDLLCMHGYHVKRFLIAINRRKRVKVVLILLLYVDIPYYYFMRTLRFNIIWEKRKENNKTNKHIYL